MRFPDGTSIQYNNAHYAVRNTAGYTDLYDCKDEKARRWIAQFPNSCVIEVSPACRVYNALSNEGSIHTLMGAMRNFGIYSDEMRALITLKKELSKLNSKTKTWK